MPHDAGDMTQVNKVPMGKNKAIKRNQLISWFQVQGMRALDEQMEILETKVDTVETKMEKCFQELSEIKRLLQQLLNNA